MILPDFFTSVKCFFLVKNSHFGRPKTKLSFSKVKSKKKKKKSPHLFYNFSYFHFQFSTFPFIIFLLFLFFSIFTPFPFFPCLFFPNTSVKISQSEVSGGLCPPHYATAILCIQTKSKCTPHPGIPSWL